MKKKLLFLISILFVFNGINTFAKNFILPSPKSRNPRSKTSIKENIGSQIKGALDGCMSLFKEIGRIQMKLASVQEQLFKDVEKLIGNKSPFKKAKIGELKKYLEKMEKLNVGFKKQLNSFRALHSELNNDNYLK